MRSPCTRTYELAVCHSIHTNDCDYVNSLNQGGNRITGDFKIRLIQLINCHVQVDTGTCSLLRFNEGGRKLGAHREDIYVEVSQSTTVPLQP